ncbi:hypothetical protein [Actinacidiphila guanduensis]|uniref:Uncharacterized protein n=1 Tax=Actinacidiphila guanduensis TaxID=310781 RepID=A0A1H0J8A5_9ACTN|nr:hypothetical protein [Actinacidiphila guanduensis]SDO39967.1 hypothetical protein SAMN05216259_109281 [Actinacidiphila guanduensis]
MRRHRFEPAALVMGLVLITLAVFFLLDASGVWDLSRPRETVPIVVSGLALAAVTALVTQAVRIVRGRLRRRRRT